MHFNYQKNNADGTPDVNWNKAIANTAFRQCFYKGLNLTNYYARTNKINPLKCENDYYTMPGVCYNTKGEEYTTLVAKEMGFDSQAYDGKTMIRLRSNNGDITDLKKQAMDELSAIGVTFPVHAAYHIIAGSTTALDTATVLKQCFTDSFGDDFIVLDIKTYVSSITQEVRNPQLQSFVINGWGADYGDPQNYLGQEVYGNDNAYYSANYSYINEITEETPENQYIKSITVDGKLVDGNEACVNIGDNIGEDEKGTNGNTVPGVQVVFTNTAHKPITIDVEKKWQDSKGGKLTTGLPESIRIKLQRRHEGSADDAPWTDVKGTEVALTKDDTGKWTHTFTGMDACDISDNNNTYYEYRVVEWDAEKGQYTASGTLTLGNYNYKVDSETKTITNKDDSVSLTLTNKQVPPVYELAITKQGLDENGATTGPLSGVEFKLEKLNNDNSVDTTFNNSKGFMPGKTAGDGDNAGKCSFTKLSEGSYRLTELKTVDGYNLLAAPIEFTLQNGKCLINGETQNIVEGTPASGYTVSLTINNRKGFTLPHTGADAPSLWLLIGLPLLVAGLLVLVFRYNRKGGKRS